MRRAGTIFAAAALLATLRTPASADPPGLPRADPPVREVQRAAIRYAELHPGQAARWADRIRASSWLPEVRVRYYRHLGRRENLQLEPGNADQLGIDGNDESFFEVRASWSLDRLVFNGEELRAAQQAASLAAEREDLLALVTRLYFERQRILEEMRVHPPEDPIVQGERLSRADEIGALLDGLTGGAFLSIDRVAGRSSRSR